eukprot:1022293_1
MSSFHLLFIWIHVIYHTTSQWVQLATNVKSSGGWAVGSYGRTIYLLGGFQDSHGFIEYDMDANKFTSINNSPIDGFQLSQDQQFYTQQGDILYMFKDNLALTMFNLATLTFTHAAYLAFETNIGGLSCLTSSSEFVYVVGGRNLADYITTVQVLILQTQQWRVTNMNQARAYHTCTVNNNYLYALGGYDGSNFVHNTERMQADLTGIRSHNWEDSVPLQIPVIYTRALSYGNRIFVLGGSYNSRKIDTIQIIDTASGTLSFNTLPVALSSMGAQIIDSKIYLIGGKLDGSGNSNKAWYYDLITNDPTKRPSETPTRPTNAPSHRPTEKTDSPSKTPSASPSMGTEDPTKKPSLNPTISPIPSPSQHPTRFPSRYPSVPPTKFPTESPIIVPTTATVPPTRAPSAVPSYTPSVMPSAPSTPPTVTPSHAPIVKTNDDQDDAEEGLFDGLGSSKDTWTVVLAIVAVLLCTVVGALIVHDYKNKVTRTMSENVDNLEKQAQSGYEEGKGNAKDSLAGDEDTGLKAPGDKEQNDEEAAPDEDDILAQVLALSLAEEEARKQEQIELMTQIEEERERKKRDSARIEHDDDDAVSLPSSDDDVLNTEKITTGNDEIVDEYKQDVEDVMDDVALNGGMVEQDGIGLASDSDEDVLIGGDITMGSVVSNPAVLQEEVMFDTGDLPESDNSDDDVLVGENIGTTRTGGGDGSIALPGQPTLGLNDEDQALPSTSTAQSGE